VRKPRRAPVAGTGLQHWKEMTEHRSPWARPPAGSDDPASSGAHSSVSPVITTPPQTRSATAADAGRTEPATMRTRATNPGYRSGTVTRLAPPPPPIPPANAPPEDDPARRNRMMLRWFGGGALAVVVIGLVVVLAMIMTGTGPRRLAKGPSDTRPELAKLCPPPTADAGGGGPPAAPPAGPRTVDARSGISYQAYGEPWQPWRDAWTKGTLHVSYTTGQYFVTENYVDQDGSRNTYLASILSGAVPAANNDALTLDLQCTGRQVAADVRAEYYPRPNSMELLRDELTTVGGRPAWVSTFRMHFHQQGLKATDELVGVALVDVGRPQAAVLYVSIPGTHRDYDWVVDATLNSVRPAG